MRIICWLLFGCFFSDSTLAETFSLKVTPGREMAAARVCASAISQRGRLFVVGGEFIGNGNPPLFETIDPDSGTFRYEEGPQLATAVRDLLALDSRQLFFLGERPLFQERLVPGFRNPNQNWEYGTHPRQVRSWFTVTALPRGRVLVLGGKEGRPVDAEPGTPTAHLLEGEIAHAPRFDQWEPTAPMTHGRALHQATAIKVGGEDAVLVTGGQNFDYRSHAHSELYFADRNVWEPVGELLNARYMHTATALKDGRVIVVGGEAGQYSLHRVEVFDPNTRQFSEVGNLRTSRSRHTATLLEIKGRPFVLVAGGFEMIPGNRGGTLDSVELIDVDRREIHQVGKMTRPRHFHYALAMDGGKVMVGGGRICHGGFRETETLEVIVQD